MSYARKNEKVGAELAVPSVSFEARSMSNELAPLLSRDLQHEILSFGGAKSPQENLAPHSLLLANSYDPIPKLGKYSKDQSDRSFILSAIEAIGGISAFSLSLWSAKASGLADYLGPYVVENLRTFIVGGTYAQGTTDPLIIGGAVVTVVTAGASFMFFLNAVRNMFRGWKFHRNTGIVDDHGYY